MASDCAELEKKIINVLNEAQNGIQYHQKQLKILKQILDQYNSSIVKFFDIFFRLLSNLLIVSKREPATERLVEFVARFAVATAPIREVKKEDEEESSSEDEEELENNFLYILVIKLFEFHEAKDRAVRLRVCQIIAKTLLYGKEVHISSSLLDYISDILLVRLNDRYVLVRVQAAMGLSYLQEPRDPECEVTNALMWSMENDTSVDVRRCLVQNIVFTQHTLPAVIERTRDVSDIVRRCAFLALSEKSTIRHLTIKQRLQLLSDGLQDRSDQVKEACVRGLLRNWCLNLDADFLSLLRRLDVESSPKIGELALTSLFDDLRDEELVQSFVDIMTGQKNEELVRKEEVTEMEEVYEWIRIFKCMLVSHFVHSN